MSRGLLGWSERWDGFLSEADAGEGGRARLVHERLVKARRSLVSLVNAGTLFTYLAPGSPRTARPPATSNSIEGGVNAWLRAMLRDHRGLSIERRLRVVFWWCHMHSPSLLPATEILCVMPTDRLIAVIYDRLDERQRLGGHPPPRRCCGLVGAPSLGAEPDGLGLGLTHFLSYKPQRTTICSRRFDANLVIACFPR